MAKRGRPRGSTKTVKPETPIERMTKALAGTPLTLLLRLEPGTIVKIGDRLARIAWHWTFRAERDATAVRWRLPDGRWSEPATLNAEIGGEVVQEMPAVADVSGPADFDPLAGERGDRDLFKTPVSSEETPEA